MKCEACTELFGPDDVFLAICERDDGHASDHMASVRIRWEA